MSLNETIIVIHYDADTTANYLKNYTLLSHDEIDDIFINKEGDTNHPIEFEEYNTLDLTFFNFDMLDVVDDVFITNHRNRSYISLKELLNSETCKHYTNKEIKKAHNVLKMFLAGALSWRKYCE